MNPEKRPLPRAEKLEKKKPNDYMDVKNDEDLPEAEETRAKLGRVVIELIRRRLYESKEKYRLRKKLRKERNERRKKERELSRERNNQ